jgi:phage N-6-adenine-methyltransferase
MNEVHYSSQTNEWATPQDLFDRLNQEFGFTLDPCATPENAKCERFYTKGDDGLSKSWAGETVFVNPPYGRQIRLWIKKAAEEVTATVVCLIPARTDTSYWHDYIWDEENNQPYKGVELRFIRGRIKFGSMDKDAPFPSCLVIFRADRVFWRRNYALSLFSQALP